MTKVETQIVETDNSIRSRWLSDGFFIHQQSIFPDNLVETALNGVEAVRAGIYDRNQPRMKIGVGQPNQLQRITQIHHANNALFEMVSLKKIGELVSQMTGAKSIRVWGTQLYYKPASSALTTQVGFHTDAQHLKFLDGEFLSAWIPLVDITMEMGPLLYINGSHKWGVSFHSSGAENQDLTTQKHLMRLEHPELAWQVTPVLLKAGGISFHHKNTLHGSEINNGKHPRVAIALGILTEKSKFIDGEENFGCKELLANLDVCPVIYSEQ